MDPHSFSLLDPDPGGKKIQIKTEKCKEIGNNCKFIQFLKVNLHKVHCFLLYFEQSFMFFTTKLQLFTNFLKLDPDPHF